MLRNIESQDLARILEDEIIGRVGYVRDPLEIGSVRDALRCVIVLPADECKDALLRALRYARESVET